jgi:hypothetical protein
MNSLFILWHIDGQALRLSSDGLTVLCTKVSQNSTLLIINKGGVRLLEGEMGLFEAVSD